MRLWSLHPKYLDSQGFCACWREGLLAQKVLQSYRNKKIGYSNHPQLIRFKEKENSLEYLSAYLTELYKEAFYRGYNFNSNLIKYTEVKDKIKVTNGQLNYEFDHLQKKLKIRCPNQYDLNCEYIKKSTNIQTHLLFELVDGDVEIWEHIKGE